MRADEWSGPTSASLRFGQVRRIQRPEGFWGPSMPEEAVLELVAPNDVDREDAQASRDRALADGCRTSSSNQPRPLRMRRVLRRDWRDRPSTPEPRRQVRPRFASRHAEIRIRALADYRRWLDAYRNALERFRDGEREVVFPMGSFWMCVGLGCPSAPSCA